MTKVKELIKRLKALDFEAMCVQTVLEHEEQAMDLNTQQLFQGERADGSTMPPYSFVSVNYYNKPAGPIRLYDTGAFYAGFVFASLTGKSEFPLYIISTDSKSDDLQERYGKEIFGLTEENLHGYAKVFIIPALREKLRRYIKL